MHMKKFYFLMLTVSLLAMGCHQAPKNVMTYRPLGNTGLEVSEISIGCGGFEKLDTAGSIALMDMAIDSGMNYIDIYDASPVTRSNIGAALKGRRDRMIIQGHIGTIFKDGQHTRTRDVKETRQGFEDLLQRLGTDHIEVGMIHITDSPEEWNELEGSPFLEYVFQLTDGRQERVDRGDYVLAQSRLRPSAWWCHPVGERGHGQPAGRH